MKIEQPDGFFLSIGEWPWIVKSFGVGVDSLPVAFPSSAEKPLKTERMLPVAFL